MSVARDTVAGLAVRRNSDGRLLDHALRGDAVAFSEIHRRYSGRVFAFCLARLMSVDAAQDATQEVFLRLLNADADGVRSISGWLFGVARHVCIDVTRSRQRIVPTDAAELETEVAATAVHFSAEDEALSKAQADDVFLALRRMRPRYRTVLVMRELHGQSVSEIAEALAVNTGAAYTLLSRARDAFGKAYARTRDLPGACREAVELLYRETGSGISNTESEKLQSHVATCASCSLEARNAKGRPLFGGLLPLLPLTWREPKGLLARALGTLGEAAPSIGAAAPSGPMFASWTLPLAASVVAASLLAGTVSLPAQRADSSAVGNAGRTVAGSMIVVAATDSTTVTRRARAGDLREQLLLQRDARLRVGQTGAEGVAAQTRLRGSGGNVSAQTDQPTAGSGSGRGKHASGAGAITAKDAKSSPVMDAGSSGGAAKGLPSGGTMGAGTAGNAQPGGVEAGSSGGASAGGVEAP
ncbi:MAG: sigma-70 family RNA polymerase sigma factor [Coriobacteriia bacterium]|nr:sigma-70 family RNA polymerase sigma factor [Coriobacteriia bacterium]